MMTEEQERREIIAKLSDTQTLRNQLIKIFDEEFGTGDRLQNDEAIQALLNVTGRTTGALLDYIDLLEDRVDKLESKE